MKKKNTTQSSYFFWAVSIVALSILAVLALKNRGEANALIGETDPSRLPEACKNFAVTTGSTDNSSVIIFAENHDYSIETMQCMLEMMQKIETKKWSVLFEEKNIQSKEQVLREIASLRRLGKYVSADGELYEAICKRATLCSSWDDKASFASMHKIIDLSLATFVLEMDLLPAMEKIKVTEESFENTLTFLKNMRDKKIQFGYLEDKLAIIKAQVMQKIIDQYTRQKKDIIGIVQSMLKGMRAAVPVCDKAPAGQLAKCIQAASLGGEANQMRDNKLKRLVKQAEHAERKQRMTFFKAGASHAAAIKKTCGNKTAIVSHKSLVGGFRHM